MKSEIIDQKKSKFLIKIEVEPKDLVSYFQSAYDKFAPEVKIDGFRAGKAPRKLIEEAIGQSKLLSEAIDYAIQDSYYHAIKDAKLIPVTPPKVTISKYPNYGLEAQEITDSLLFEAEVETMPKVELKDYSKVKIKELPKGETSKEDVEKILTHLRRQKATFKEIDRPAKIGDRAEISYDGTVDKVKKDGMSAKNHPVILGENTLIPGFEEQIVGLKKDEEKKFEITFPKDYHSKDFAGKKAEFEVKLVDLKEVNLPELTDSFADSFGHKNLVDLKAAIGKSLEEEVEAKAKNELEAVVIEKVLPYLKVELPDGLVEQEVDRIVANMTEQIESKGMKLEKYLQSIKKTLPELRKDLLPTAEKNIRIGFLLGKIIEEEGIDQNDQEAGKKALEILIKKVTK